jgi:hypothetical protein
MRPVKPTTAYRQPSYGKVLYAGIPPVDEASQNRQVDAVRGFGGGRIL